MPTPRPRRRPDAQSTAPRAPLAGASGGTGARRALHHLLGTPTGSTRVRSRARRLLRRPLGTPNAHPGNLGYQTRTPPTLWHLAPRGCQPRSPPPFRTFTGVPGDLVPEAHSTAPPRAQHGNRGVKRALHRSFGTPSRFGARQDGCHRRTPPPLWHPAPWPESKRGCQKRASPSHGTHHPEDQEQVASWVALPRVTTAARPAGTPGAGGTTPGPATVVHRPTVRSLHRQPVAILRAAVAPPAFGL